MCVLKSPGGIHMYREEIQKSLISTEQTQSHVHFDVDSLKANAYVQGVWKEALRTGSASAAARVVVKDTELEGYVVKTGSVVLLPVQLLHFNPAVFPDPQLIDPERWIDSEQDERQKERLKQQNLHLRSFGGGTGLCSGRFVAEQEVISVVSTILLLFDLEFITPVEKFRFNPRSIGIMSPAEGIVVKLRRRKLGA